MRPAGLSIVTPVYRAEKTLSRTMESIRKSLSATPEKERIPIEHILVFDGPQSDSEEIAHAEVTFPGIDRHIVTKKHSGIADSRNVGLRRARYSHCTFLDSDDELMPARIVAASTLSNQVLIGLQEVKFDVSSPIPADVPDPERNGGLSGFFLSNMVAPTELLLSMGGFQTDLTLSDDLELVMRLRRNEAAIEFRNEVFAIRHVTGENASLDYASLRTELFQILRSFRDYKKDVRKRK